MKEIRQYKWGFWGRLAVLIPVYGLIGWRIYIKVGEIFNYMAEGSSDVRISMDEYWKSIIIVLIATAAVNILWLSMAYVRTEIRRWYEENTLVCAIICVLVLLGIIVFMRHLYEGIIDDRGNMHKLYYSYAALPGLIFNLFLLPPQTVSGVIVPGGRKTEFVVTAFSIFVAIMLLM